MNESFDQQAAHKPAPSTGSRQAAHSCGSATSTTSPSVARSAAATRAQRLPGGSAASISPCMSATVAPPAGNDDKDRADGLIREMSPPPSISDRRLLRARRARAALLGASNFLVERV